MRSRQTYRLGYRAKTKRWLMISGVTLVGLGLGASGLYLAAHRQPQLAASQPSAPAVAQTKTQPSLAVGRYLFNGTANWNRAIERDAKGDYNRPFSQLSTFQPSNYDAWIADLECPVTPTPVPYQTQVDSLVFNCSPAFLPAARQYFSIFDLANNHTYDQGRSGFLETQKQLTAAGFQVFGSYDPGDIPNICEVISLPIHLTSATSSTPASLPVAFCAFHALARSPTDAEMGVVAAYAKVMPVFAFAHLGVEYTPASTLQQQTLAHRFIDAGAEFVIMNHPHWVQETEVYQGKLIVYSTGNFIFDQLTYEEQRSASYAVQLTTANDANLTKWITYGQTCAAAALNDSCYSHLPKDLTKPQLQLSYQLVAGDERPPARWIPRLADATLQQATEQRANWAATLQKLNQTGVLTN